MGEVEMPQDYNEEPGCAMGAVLLLGMIIAAVAAVGALAWAIRNAPEYLVFLAVAAVVLAAGSYLKKG